jgi:sugar phosphate isomerase/epimerase
MLIPGLVSVTFRSLAPGEIVRVAHESGLRGIEWGGDVHVPHGDVKRAGEVARMTRDAGLAVAAYGSYFRLGQSAAGGLPFARVLETAVALGAPSIRVWAGTIGSDKADDAHRRQIADESHHIADAAAAAGVVVAYEYHGGTLTDAQASTAALLASVPHPNLKTLWQPSIPMSIDEREAALVDVLPRLLNVHVFQWHDGARLPLREGATEWARYLAKVRSTGRDHYALLEFVRNESVEQLREDAVVLREWVEAPPD